jgi:hypothetical protein
MMKVILRVFYMLKFKKFIHLDSVIHCTYTFRLSIVKSDASFGLSTAQKYFVTRMKLNYERIVMQRFAHFTNKRGNTRSNKSTCFSITKNIENR